jgi:hypothetical protein
VHHRLERAQIGRCSEFPAGGFTFAKASSFAENRVAAIEASDHVPGQRELPRRNRSCEPGRTRILMRLAQDTVAMMRSYRDAVPH